MRELVEAIDALADEPLEGVDGRALGREAAALVAARNRLDAELLRRVRAFDRSGRWRDDGSSSAASWLGARTTLDPGEARALTRTARRLRRLPATSEAIAVGTISLRHAQAIARATDELPSSVVEEVDRRLADVAPQLGSRDFGRIARRLAESLDESESPDADTSVFARRYLHVSPTLDGLVAVDGMLDPVAGEALRTALDALEVPDPAAAPDDVRRTPAQRRADAMGDLARRALDHRDVPTVGGEHPHVTLTMTIEQVADRAGWGQLDWSGDVSRSTVERLLCDAGLDWMVTDSEEVPLHYGRARRHTTAPQRRAVVVRDGHCRFPGCDRKPQWCHAHHVVWWDHGGPTDLDNLMLVCSFHHSLIHKRGFEVKLLPDATVEVVTPSGETMTSRPRDQLPDFRW